MLSAITNDAFSQDKYLVRDTVSKDVIFFRFDKSNVDNEYLSNQATINKLDSLLLDDNFISSMDSIVIVATSSPEGPVRYNRELSKKRAESVRQYLLTRYIKLKGETIFTYSIDENWTGLKELIENDPKAPYKERLIKIVSTDVNPATKEWRLKQVGGGEAWKYIKINYLKYLRVGATSVIFYKKTLIPEPEPIVEPEPVVEEVVEVVEEPVVVEPEEVYIPLAALKTNVLFDLATVLNIEAEVPIGDRYSISGEWMFPWWQKEKSDWTLQMLSAHGAAKYWFGDRTDMELLTGWSAGLYGGWGKYDLQFFEKDGVQGDFFNIGVQGAYAQRITRNIRIEYLLGIGFLRSDYQKYEKIRKTEFGDIKVVNYPWEERRRSLFGPTNAKISFVWLFDYKSKRKKGGEKW